MVITSADLYTWAPVHCTAPRAGLDAYFSSGFPITSYASINRDDWYTADVIGRLNNAASEYFAFDSATIYVFFKSGIPVLGSGVLDYKLSIQYYPAGTTTFTTNTSNTERVSLGKSIAPGTIVKITVNPDDLEVGGYVGARLFRVDGLHPSTVVTYSPVPSDQQAKVNYVIVGSPAGADVNTQTVMFGDQFTASGADVPTSSVSIKTGDIISMSKPDNYVTSVRQINTDGVYTTGTIFRANVDNATYTPYTSGDRKYASVATPMYTAAGTDNDNNIVVPGYMLSDKAGTTGPHNITCNIINPWGADGANVTRSYNPHTGSYPVPATPWFTGSFRAVSVVGSNALNLNLAAATLPNQPPTVLLPHINTTVYNLPAVDFTFPDRLEPGPIMFERSTGANHRIILYSEPAINVTACKLTSMTSMQSSQMENLTWPPRYYPKYDVFLESKIAFDEPFRYNCQTAAGNMSGTIIADQPAFIGLLANVTGGNDVFGWGGGQDFLGIGLVGFLGLMSCMVGFNRKNLAPAAVTFVIAITLMGYFGILEVSEALLAAIIVVVILAVFQRRQ